MLGLTLRSVRDFSIVRALRLPIINCCFDRYVELNRESLIIMDQANMQLVWSVGAFGSRYGTRQLNSLCRAARGNFERLFVFVAVSPEISAKRIRERATRSSRFDPLTGASLDSQLHAAASLMSDIHSHLATDNERLVVLDAEASPEANAANLVAEIGHFTRPPAKPADGAPEGSIHS